MDNLRDSVLADDRHFASDVVGADSSIAGRRGSDLLGDVATHCLFAALLLSQMIVWMIELGVITATNSAVTRLPD